MSKENVPHNRYVSNGLHPHVYLAMVGLAAWYALSAWAGFGTAAIPTIFSSS